MVLLRDLRKLLNNSLDTLEAEILAQGLPELSFAAVPHILDDPLWLPPPRLYEARRAASAAIDMLGALVRPSWETLYEGPFGATVVASFTVVAELNIANHLAGEGVDAKLGLPVEVLAELTHVDPGRLSRCLRVMADQFVFTETSPNVFANNRISLGLQSPGGFHSWALLNGRYFAPVHLALNQYIAGNAQNPAFQISAKDSTLSFYDWLYTDKERLRWFSSGMQGCGSLSLAGVINDYPWESLGQVHVVDVGGGQGALCYPLLERHSKLRVTIQEIPKVLASAKVHLVANYPTLNPARVSFQGHDFFKPNPIFGDDVVYLARWILHNWPDSKAIDILKAMSSVMTPNSKILLVEMVAKPGTPSIIPQSSYAASLASLSKDPSVPFAPLDLPAPLSVNAGMKAVGMMDLTIMGLCEALERTEEQFRTLLDAAGLELVKVYYTRGYVHVTEARLKR